MRDAALMAPTIDIGERHKIRYFWWHQCVEKIIDRWETALINHFKVFVMNRS